jgi:RNA polymerase sigma-70 factor (sigma-E family)
MAQDLVQTSLGKVWPRWDRIERQDEPEAYVRRVMVTTYATWWRRRWRGEVPYTVPDSVMVPDPLESVDQRAALTAALATLIRGQRAVVVLRYFHDLSEADTAAVLGCGVGTVKSQHSRALARLRASAALGGLPHGQVEGFHGRFHRDLGLAPAAFAWAPRTTGHGVAGVVHAVCRGSQVETGCPARMGSRKRPTRTTASSKPGVAPGASRALAG